MKEWILTHWFIIIYLYYLLVIGVPYVQSYESSMQFDPKGRLRVLDKAIQASNQGDPMFAMKLNDGILLLSAKLVDFSTTSFEKIGYKKVHRIHSNLYIGLTGLLFDSIEIVDVSKKIELEHRNKFGENIPLGLFCNELANIFHKQTCYSSSRPLGVSLLVCGWDETNGLQIYTIFPDGSYYSWNGIAIGKLSSDIKKSLQDLLKDKTQDRKINNFLKLVKKSIINQYFKAKEDDDKVWEVDIHIASLSNDEKLPRDLKWEKNSFVMTNTEINETEDY